MPAGLCRSLHLEKTGKGFSRKPDVEGSTAGALPIGCNCLPVLMADRVGAGVDRYMMYSLVFVWIILLTAACDVENLTERKQTGREFQKILHGWFSLVW